MKTVNTHGMTMTGLRAAAGSTKHHSHGCHTQISYDRADGQVLTNYHTPGNWSRYHSDTIITVCDTSAPMTMQQIADAVAETVGA